MNKLQQILKLLIAYACILFSCLNTVFAQSDTVRWDKYLYIKTQLCCPTKYVHEYQDTLGNIIIPQGKYSSLGAPDKYGFINAWKESTGGKDIENNVGFIDIHENILIPFDYSQAFSFHQNLACVTKNGKTGYINRKGETVIPFLYDSRKNFYNDGVVVLKKGKKQILIDTLGNEIIDMNHSYQEIKENFPHDHVLWVQKENKWAFFDLKGNPLTPFIFDKMHPANVCSYQPNLWYGKDFRWFYKGLIVVEKDGQFAVLNEKMEYLIPWETYQWISPMSVGGLMIVKQEYIYGLLNHQLELMQPIGFNEISNNPASDHEQKYPSFWARKGDKYYIFDTLGRWADKIEYDNIELLQANFYLATKKGKQWRLDRNGTRIFDNFLIVKDDRNGFIARRKSLLGFVSKDGDVIIPFKYEDIITEHFGNIFVKKDGKWGVVDDENQQLLPCKYDWIREHHDNNRNDCYVVVQNDKFGKVTETGEELFPCLYDGITTWVEYGPNGHYVMIGDKMGLIDNNGSIIVPIEYESVSWVYGTNLAKICNKGKMGIYDIKNQSFFLPLEYDFIAVDVDYFKFGENKLTQIFTYKDVIVNALDEKGEIIRSNVSKSEIEMRFNVNLDTYQYSPCSYELLLMIHNRTFNAPDCLLESLKDRGGVELIYYKM